MNTQRILVSSTSGFDKREGIGSVLFETLSRFDPHAVKIDLIVSGSYDASIVKQFEGAGIRPVYLADRHKEAAKYYKQLLNTFKANEYDVFYINGSSALMLPDLLVAKLSGCRRRVVHSHNTRTDHPILHLLLWPFFQHLVTIPVACGSEAGKWLFHSKHFEVLNNGRPITKFKYSDEKRLKMRKVLGLEPGTVAFGHVGNFNTQKNQQLVVRIFAQYKRFHPGSHLFLVGTGEKYKDILRLVQELNLSEGVTFLGSIDCVQDFIQAMDMMLLPSLFEGVPLVVVEWQIAGVSSIISNSISTECVFGDGVYQLSIDDDLQAWSMMIEKIQSADSVQSRMARSRKNADLATISGFNIEENARQLQDMMLSKRGN